MRGTLCWLIWLNTTFVLVSAAQVLPSDESAFFDVPMLEHVRIDGDASDWRSSGFRVEIVGSVDGRAQAPDDFDPVFRLGWDSRGLLLLATVRDDEFVEEADQNALDRKDSVEVFMTPARGAADLIHFVLSPGVSAEFSNLRWKTFDWRKAEPKSDLTLEAARGAQAGGYTIEAVFPWANLNLTPRIGDQIAIQILFNDFDHGGERFQAAWYPAAPPSGRTNAVYRIRLARKPTRPVVARIRGEYDDLARTRISVIASQTVALGPWSVHEGRRELARATASEMNGRPSAQFQFAMPEVGKTYGLLDIRAGRRTMGEILLPDATVVRARRMMTFPMTFRPPVFQGEDFPPCDFKNPLLAERLVGPYQIKTTFYDREYNVVAKAESPGRYGAVVEVVPESGTPLKRYFTLFREPQRHEVFAWWVLEPQARVQFPPFFGINDAILDAQHDAVAKFVQWQFTDALADDQESAAVLAGLSETPADSPPRRYYDDAFAMDRQWWVGLKRKLSGGDAQFPRAVVCPYQNEGGPATVLRHGTPQEAGMKPDAFDRIDAVCSAWVEESKEPFAVCIARHGVVFFHKAYGERDGKPMTVDTKSWMASITKFLSGVLMMTLVDQGYVDLDAPIERYLPAFRGIEVRRPLTIRHLYTHTNGLQLGIQPPRMYWDHWGDEMHDLEEVIAGYYPHLEVGKRSGYNGVGYALAGKIIEAVSGESVPQYFHNHLWGPLGCNNTETVDMSARGFSTPWDMAVLGQMLLNRGGYGNLRFFSEETFEKLLPVKLAPYVDFETDAEWGIGAVWMRDPGLGPNTFAHGAASAATLRIDPEHDLVIVMTRNSGGPAWGKYHPQFIQAVVENLGD